MDTFVDFCEDCGAVTDQVTVGVVYMKRDTVNQTGVVEPINDNDDGAVSVVGTACRYCDKEWFTPRGQEIIDRLLATAS